MHHHAWRFVERIAAQIGPCAAVLEIGARDINGSVRPLWQTACYHGVDLVDGPGVDRIANGATVTLPYPLDVVVCCEVLEHTPDAERIITHALDLLTPGGHLVVTAAAPPRLPHSAVDGGECRPDEHYANIEPDELKRWIYTGGGLVKLLTYSAAQGDVHAWAVKA